LVWLLRFLLYSISGDFMCTFSILSSRHHLFFSLFPLPSVCIVSFCSGFMVGFFSPGFFSPPLSQSRCVFDPITAWCCSSIRKWKERMFTTFLACIYSCPSFFLHLAIPVLPYPIPPYMYHLSIISSAICRSFLCPERKPGYAPSHPTRNMINVSDGLSLICSDT